MMKNGALAVAIVKRQVMIVQAIRSHTQRDKYLDVHIYSPFSDRVFLVGNVPNARIASTDILTIFPVTDVVHVPAQGMLELPQQAFFEYIELNSRHQKRCERLWSLWNE